jgi:SAM-dependent MidA family methyltransferase
MTAWTDSAIGGEALPDEFEGVVIARELLSAMPAHVLSLQGDRLVETHVELAGDSLVTGDRPPSSGTLADHVRDSGLEVPPDRSVTVSPDALGWVASAAGRLRRGFILVIDRGDRANEPLSWLDAPGEQPIAANVDFAAVRRTAEHEGCVTARFISQASYLAELAHHLTSGFTDEERRAFAALTGPAGCGQTTRVLMLVKNMDLQRGELS